MLENWVFMTGLLLLSLLFAFHGAVLLIVPRSYLPLDRWGPARLELHAKPPSYISRRVSGTLLLAAVAWFPIRFTISWMLHPTLMRISWGPASPPGIIRWDLFLLGVLALTMGLSLTFRPEKSARLLLGGEKEQADITTIKVWVWYVRVAGVYATLFSLFPMSEFIRSLR